MRERSIPKIIISHLIGLVIFILILVLANIYLTGNGAITEIVGFLNDNLALIVVMSILFMLADILYALVLPFNLPAPIFSAIGSILVVMFIFRTFGLIDLLLIGDLLSSLLWIRWILYPVVFLIVLVSGYISIFFGMFESPREYAKERKEQKTKDNIIWIEMYESLIIGRKG